MTDLLSFARAIDGVPMVADAAAREARFPVATRVQDQRVYRLDTSTTERWSGSAWLAETPHIPVNAAPNGATDATAAFNAAITAAASSGQVVRPRPGTYQVQGIAMQSNVTLDLTGVTLVKNGGAAGTVVIGMTGSTTATSVSAAANIALGDTVLTGTSPSGFAIGDWVLVYDNTYKYGTSGRNQEINRVAGVTTNLTLANRTIGSYATASGATIVKLAPIVNAHVIGSGTIQIPTGTAGGGVLGTLCVDCTVDGPTITGPNDLPGARFQQSYRCHIRSAGVRDGQNQATGGFGYGVSLSDSSHHCSVEDCDIENVRENQFTNNVRHSAFVGNRINSVKDSFFNTHASGCAHILIAENIGTGSANGGFLVCFAGGNAADTDVTVQNNQAVNVAGRSYSVDGVSSLVRAARVRFLGNTTRNGSCSSANPLIQATNADDVTVEGGVLSGGNATAFYGLYASGVTNFIARNVRVSDITNASGRGIEINNCTTAILDGLVFTNIGGNNVMTSGTNTGVSLLDNTTDDAARSLVGGEFSDGNVWGPKVDRARGKATSVSDGGSITHNCVAGANAIVNASGSVAGEIVSVTAVFSTSFTVAIKNNDGTAGTTQTVYWEAEV